MMPTFGIEEEFMLVDRLTLVPVDRASDAITDLAARSHRGEIKAEFLASQLEHSTAVCESLDDARRDVVGARRALHAWASERDLLVIGSGTPFALPMRVSTSPADRYQLIAEDVGMLTEQHLLNGMHVHVGVSDQETGVTVANELRAWLPLLLALSSNSPFWDGQDTSHHSWRAVQSRRWTTYGVPPHFRDHAEYVRSLERLVGIGATTAYSSNGWAVRLSARFPTVEIRICDTQLDAESTLALASIVRALGHGAASRTPAAPAVRAHVLDSELWHAGRYGLTNGVFDATCGAHVEASAAITSLAHVIAPFIDEHGSAECVDDFIQRIRADGTGADRQRHALRDGREALAFLHDRVFAC